MLTDNAASEDGWTLLRYTAAMVREGHAAHRISCFIKRHTASSQPAMTPHDRLPAD